MANTILNKMKKTYIKLLKAWVKGKEKKAIKLQHKMVKLEFKNKRLAKQNGC